MHPMYRWRYSIVSERTTVPARMYIWVEIRGCVYSRVAYIEHLDSIESISHQAGLQSFSSKIMIHFDHTYVAFGST